MIPPAAASGKRRVRERPLAVGPLGSHDGSACQPLLLPESFPAPGVGTLHDARVRSAVSNKCDSLLQMCCDAGSSWSTLLCMSLY